MDYSKLIVCLLAISLFTFAAAETNLSSEQNASVVNNSIGILPVEETPAPAENTIVIQPIEENPPVQEETLVALPVENSSSITAGLVIEPIVVQPSIIKTVLELVLSRISILRGQLAQLTASLFYENRTPMTNKEISFYANEEKIGSDITDGQGAAKVWWNTSPFAPGTYVISAEYKGEAGIAGSSAGGNVVITEIVPAVKEPAVNETPLAIAAVAEPAAISGVSESKDCKTITYKREEYVYGTCARPVTHMVCSDAPANTSCTQPTFENYNCPTGTKMVQHSYQDCDIKGYNITSGGKQVVLHTTEYACTPAQEADGSHVVICDSKFDGNGDGKCTSGESCQKFVIAAGAVGKYERNSQDEFTASDDSYVVDDVSVEVKS